MKERHAQLDLAELIEHRRGTDDEPSFAACMAGAQADRGRRSGFALHDEEARHVVRGNRLASLVAHLGARQDIQPGDGHQSLCRRVAEHARGGLVGIAKAARLIEGRHAVGGALQDDGQLIAREAQVLLSGAPFGDVEAQADEAGELPIRGEPGDAHIHQPAVGSVPPA